MVPVCIKFTLLKFSNFTFNKLHASHGATISNDAKNCLIILLGYIYTGLLGYIYTCSLTSFTLTGQ